MHDTIPAIDLGAWYEGDAAARQEVAAAVDAACRSIGFLVITGHRIAPALIADVRRQGFAFFDLPEPAKQALRPPPGVMLRGYTPPQTNTLALSRGQRTPPDFREMFSVGSPAIDGTEYAGLDGARVFYNPNLWPAAMPGFRATLEAYVREMERLAQELMRIFATGLGMPATFFDRKIDRNFAAFHILHYGAAATPPLPGQLRAGAHSDFGSLTILQPPSGDEGLEVMSPDKDGESRWIKAAVPENAYVINIGDLMQHWTNDRWVSTLHRVVNPAEGTGWSSRRISLGYFCHPNYDAELACLPTCVDAAHPSRYEPILAGDYMRAKIAAVRHAAG
jgi:isopenicillin N synthase-like dioxygenase